MLVVGGGGGWLAGWVSIMNDIVEPVVCCFSRCVGLLGTQWFGE